MTNLNFPSYRSVEIKWWIDRSKENEMVTVNASATGILWAAVVFTAAQLYMGEASAHHRRRNGGARFELSISAGQSEAKDRESPTEPANLVEHGPAGVGGFGGVSIGYSPIVGSNGLVIGGEGALLLGHRFSIGGAGYGLVNDVSSRTPEGGTASVGLGYGGVIVRYHLVHRYPVFPAFAALIGFGGLSFDGNGGDVVMIIEPSMAVYANITRWIRLGFSISYKFMTGVDTQGLDNADFRGPAFAGHLDFGAL
jgi:hypothetical protein